MSLYKQWTEMVREYVKIKGKKLFGRIHKIETSYI